MFELAKKQEDTKVQELKKEEAVANQYSKQLEVEREKVLLAGVASLDRHDATYAFIAVVSSTSSEK